MTMAMTIAMAVGDDNDDDENILCKLLFITSTAEKKSV